MSNEKEKMKILLQQSENLLSMGGFIQKEKIKELELPIRRFIAIIADEYNLKPAIKSNLVLSSYLIVEHFLYEYDIKDDGPIYDYISMIIKENIECAINEKEELDQLYQETSLYKQALQMLPPLEKKIIMNLYKEDNKKMTAKELSKRMKYIDTKQMLKFILVTERIYAIHYDLLVTAMEGEE